uniref:CCR4-NOT transcription complex subunit 3 n=1 Tax=Timema bartmani TaxID=61472 RepID=A0A7R9HZB6_9NEOP|nr:unnamed protein product [Timema bartmani]
MKRVPPVHVAARRANKLMCIIQDQLGNEGVEWLNKEEVEKPIEIRRIKDDIEYYIESAQEPDFEENEYIYDDIIGLDEVELSGLANAPVVLSQTTKDREIEVRISVGLPSSATTDSNNSNDTGGTPTSTTSGNSPVPSPPLHNHSSDSGSNEDKKKSKEDLPTKPVKPTAVRASNSNSLINSSNCSQPVLKSVLNSSTPSKPVSGSMSQSTPNNSSPSSGLINHIGNFAAVAAANTQNTNSSSKSTSHTTENGVPSSGVMVGQSQPPSLLQLTTSPPQSVALSKQQTLDSNHHHQHNNSSPPSSVSTAPSPILGPVTLTPTQPSAPMLNGPTLANKWGMADVFQQQQQHVPEGMSSLKSIAQQVIDRAGLEIPPSERVLFESSKMTMSQLPTSEAHIPPLLGVAPLGPVPLQKEHQHQFQMMESAFFHMPHPSDSERLRPYLPRNPCPTPHYYHQVPLPHSDTVEFFQRLSTETLFFIFYYMEGTKAQYLAAKALKKQSWRFHTKYMMWFQRHEEPKVINEEYEQENWEVSTSSDSWVVWSPVRAPSSRKYSTKKENTRTPRVYMEREVGAEDQLDDPEGGGWTR